MADSCNSKFKIEFLQFCIVQILYFMLCSVLGKEEEPDTPRTKKTWLIEAKVWHWERIGKLLWKYLLEKKKII